MKRKAAIGRTVFPVRNLKGQAAIEYLINYGWAIFVLAIVIGLIISSGIFSPTYFVSEQCSFGPNLPCEAYLVEDENTPGDTKVFIRIRNGFSYNIGVQGLELSINEHDISFDPYPREIGTGDKIDITGRIEGYLTTEGSLQKVRGNFIYFSCEEAVNPGCNAGGSPSHPASGRLLIKMQSRE